MTAGWHIACPPNSEICRGYVVTAGVNRHGHPKIPPSNAVAMSDTETWRSTAVSLAKKSEPRTSDLRRPASHSSRAALLIVNCRWPIPGNNQGERGLCLTWTDLWFHWKANTTAQSQSFQQHRSFAWHRLSAAPWENIFCYRHLSHCGFHSSCHYSGFV